MQEAGFLRPGPDERIGQADLLADAQNHRIWTASDLISIQPTSAQIGGSARGTRSGCRPRGVNP
jgi:hypothetical protein